MADKTPTEVQTVILSKEKFKSADAAKKWLRAHDFKSELDETEDSYRARQKEPGDFAQGSFRTISLEEGVSAVVGHRKGEAKGLVRPGLMAWAPQAFMLDLMMLEPLVYEKPFTEEQGVAVVDIRGTLTHHAENPCLDSYDAICVRMKAALHSTCDAVIMRIDSLGGDVAGCFDLAREIRREATECGKRLYAYTDGTAASAAYALACVADEIAVGVTGFVGSVGIINAILDQTAADAAHGLRYGFATSGARKADGNPHTPITDEAMSELQKQVDALASVFYRHVAAHRPELTPVDLAGLQAGLFFGDGAVKNRLADRVCSWGEMVSFAANPPPQAGTSQSEGSTMPKYLEEARKMAAKMVEDGDDADREMAKKMMALFGDDGAPEKKEARADEESPKEEAKAEEKKEEPAAKAAYGEGEKDSEKMKAAAAVHAPTMLDLTRELYAMKAEREAEKVAAERTALLAQRPDFNAQTLAWLEAAPIDTVRKAVETIPRIATNPAAASQAKGTRGSYTPEVADADTLHIAKYMGGLSHKVGAQSSGFTGRHLEFHPMTPAEARARLAELEKGSN